MEAEFDPVLGPEPDSPRLAGNGLARVIFQARFPDVMSIQSPGFVAPFQEAVRASYPMLVREMAGPAAPVAAGQALDGVWRMQDAEGVWRLSLGSGFVSLETRVYSGRGDFCGRIRAVLDALAATVRPTHVHRLGVRCINHIGSSDPASLPDLLRPGMVGPAAIAGIRSGRLGHSVSEAVFTTDEGRLAAKWGILPPGATHDAHCMPPAPGPSLFLDVDASAEWQSPAAFDPGQSAELARKLAGRCYTFFRWSVSDSLIEAFGKPSSPLPATQAEGQFSIH